jgi:hypothetical protein
MSEDLLHRIADRAWALEKGNATMLEIAQVYWCLGELKKAIEEIETMDHVNSGYLFKESVLKVLRGEHNTQS